jgi:hypothetical protein
MTQLREQEKAISKEIQDYLNQIDESPIIIDGNTILTQRRTVKKINKNSKAYQTFLEELCQDKTIKDSDFISAVIGGKVETTIQQQKLKLVKFK